jgi:hypothetical protein
VPLPSPEVRRARAAAGGHARAAKLGKERCAESARKAHLHSIVAQIIARAPELSADQTAKLRAIFAPVVSQEAERP